MVTSRGRHPRQCRVMSWTAVPGGYEPPAGGLVARTDRSVEPSTPDTVKPFAWRAVLASNTVIPTTFGIGFGSGPFETETFTVESRATCAPEAGSALRTVPTGWSE